MEEAQKSLSEFPHQHLLLRPLLVSMEYRMVIWDTSLESQKTKQRQNERQSRKWKDLDLNVGEERK